jgi:hypothetical protein
MGPLIDARAQFGEGRRLRMPEPAAYETFSRFYVYIVTGVGAFAACA